MVGTDNRLDVPAEGIQPSIVDEIVGTLHKPRQTQALTMMLVEQVLHFIADPADAVLIIQKGTITREVTPHEISDPALIAEFVGLGP